ncbi:MAG: hypothetical protein K0R84_200 [Clostridia bacterium]|nr:hypothetical protein [Clostridia bacterium]
MIYKELNEEIVLFVNEPVSIRALLQMAGINPTVVPAVYMDESKKDKDYMVTKEDSRITVLGPLAGG